MVFHSAYTQKKSHEGNVAKSYAWDNINLPNPNIKPSINNPIQNLSFDRIMYLTVKNYATVEQEYLTWYIYSISYLKFICFIENSNNVKYSKENDCNPYNIHKYFDRFVKNQHLNDLSTYNEQQNISHETHLIKNKNSRITQWSYS